MGTTERLYSIYNFSQVIIDAGNDLFLYIYQEPELFVEGRMIKVGYWWPHETNSMSEQRAIVVKDLDNLRTSIFWLSKARYGIGSQIEEISF